MGEDWRDVASPIRDVTVSFDFPLTIFVQLDRETSGIEHRSNKKTVEFCVRVWSCQAEQRDGWYQSLV